MKLSFTIFALTFVAFSLAPVSHAAERPETPAERHHEFDTCVWLLKQKPADQRRAFRAGALSLEEILRDCETLVRIGWKRAAELDREAEREKREGAPFRGSLGCLANEHYVNGSCQPKSLVRCDSGFDCAFSEKCTGGVCN